jgi:hypothetical protein
LKKMQTLLRILKLNVLLNTKKVINKLMY